MPRKKALHRYPAVYSQWLNVAASVDELRLRLPDHRAVINQRADLYAFRAVLREQGLAQVADTLTFEADGNFLVIKLTHPAPRNHEASTNVRSTPVSPRMGQHSAR